MQSPYAFTLRHSGAFYSYDPANGPGYVSAPRRNVKRPLRPMRAARRNLALPGAALLALVASIVLATS